MTRRDFAPRLAGFLLLLLVLLAHPTRAQQAGDTLSAACPPMRVVPLCVTLDASRSVDASSGPLTYRWQMGDGTTLVGLQVEHCYQERRRYVVQLDVVETQTGLVRSAEKLIPVDFTQETVLAFTAPDTVRVGQPTAFDALDSQLPACQNAVVLWDFRDGGLAQGRQARHTFRRPGLYQVRMSLRANGPDACPDSHCVSRSIWVVP